MKLRWAAVTLALGAAPAAAQQVLPVAAVAAPVRPVQSAGEAVAQDAAEYARAYGVSADEAARRLLAQEETVATTDALRARFAERLAGIVIEHRPVWRIAVLLTGDAPVADEWVEAAGMPVPIVFRTGARATRDAVVAAIEHHQKTLRAMLPHPPGLGHDPRTGELVVMAQQADVDLFGADLLRDEFADITGVPVAIRTLAAPDRNAGVEGGSRVEGVNPANGVRYACTTGFVVTDGARSGVVTAAHCPDTLTYYDPDRTARPLAFVGQWGWGFQDVQVNATVERLEPVFYADTAKRVARPVLAQRARTSTRAGDVVCHRGERTGYSCAEVRMVDFAPAGDLCGGDCLPSWVAVEGPGCRSGDSGGPVFSGTTAFGILKGSSYLPGGRCGFYYYMSTDFLPAGWSLLRPAAVPPTPDRDASDMVATLRPQDR